MFSAILEDAARGGNVDLAALDTAIERWPWFTTARVLRMNADDADQLRLRLQAWPRPAALLSVVRSEELGVRSCHSEEPATQRHSERSEESQRVSRHSEPPTGGVELFADHTIAERASTVATAGSGGDILRAKQFASEASQISEHSEATLGASIEAFLQGGEHRIVPADGVGDENAAAASEQVSTEGGTEQLAEIFASQGLFQQAREIYERLRLQNPEKSVYFAGLIERCCDAREV